MHDDEAARREHIRRWVRPDFERFLRHDWERYVTPAGRERRLRHIAECKAAFEPPPCARERLRNAQIERERLCEKKAALEREQAWEVECAERKLKADLAWERFTTTLARYLAQQRLARKYSPDQPRVPAGSPDGGQWTSGDRPAGRDASISNDASSDELRVISDATPSDFFRPGDRVAQGDFRDSLIDLRDEEAKGGHTIQRHVNKSTDALIAQAQEAFDRDPRAFDSRSGSFSSVEAANRLVNSTLAQNRDIVDQVASGVRPREIVFAHFESITGNEVVIATRQTQPVERPTFGVGVVLEHDPLSLRRYSIVTAFPTNRRR